VLGPTPLSTHAMWMEGPVWPAGLEVSDFGVGEAVQVWSVSWNKWFEDGIVQDVSSEDCSVDGDEIPRGSLLVTYNANVCRKWVVPAEQLQLLRSPVAPIFVPGDTVLVWSASKCSWFHDGTVRTIARDSSLTEDGTAVPGGSLLVVYNGGAGVKWVAPWEQHLVLKPQVPAIMSDVPGTGGLHGEEYFLVGPHGACLGETGGYLFMVDHSDAQSWMVRPVSTAAGLRHLISRHELNLVVIDGGEQSFGLTREDWDGALWTLKPVAGAPDQYFLLSGHGTFMASLNDSMQTLYMSPNADDWEKWTLVPSRLQSEVVLEQPALAQPEPQAAAAATAADAAAGVPVAMTPVATAPAPAPVEGAATAGVPEPVLAGGLVAPAAGSQLPPLAEGLAALAEGLVAPAAEVHASPALSAEEVAQANRTAAQTAGAPVPTLVDGAVAWAARAPASASADGAALLEAAVAPEATATAEVGLVASAAWALASAPAEWVTPLEGAAAAATGAPAPAPAEGTAAIEEGKAALAAEAPVPASAEGRHWYRGRRPRRSWHQRQRQRRAWRH